MGQLEPNKVNVSLYLKEIAKKYPYKRAVVFPAAIDKNKRIAYTHLTFQQLDQESDNIATGLHNSGIVRGTKTILMVKPSLEFFAITYALFKVGAIPVVVDPGMGIKRMVECFQESDPEAFIGIPKAHILRPIYPNFFKSVKTWITVGKKWFWKGLTLNDITPKSWQHFKIAETTQNETAAILFTTGSTGHAKGVIYTHGIFDAQVNHIKSHFNITEDEIDLPTFPLFALFDPALGITAIIPDMDPTKPAFVNPPKIIEAINNHGVTNMFASPALLNRVGSFGKQNNIKLFSLKRVVSAGAPVSPDNIERFSSMLPKNVEIHTPYGATESMPVLSIASNEILSETRQLSEQGFGTCIGRPVENIEVKLIKITDTPIVNWSNDLIVNKGEIGEITVKGKVVTTSYYNNPDAEALSKIQDSQSFWHRMGDLGWMDQHGRIWFCGRKSHRVITAQGPLYTIPCESIFNNHQSIFRSALVGVGKKDKQIPVICIELKKNLSNIDKKRIKKELFELAKSSEITKKIEHILFKNSFPVDIRHNSKIFREKLSLWAAKKI